MWIKISRISVESFISIFETLSKNIMNFYKNKLYKNKNSRFTKVFYEE